MQGSLHSLTYTIHNRIILLLYCWMTSAFKFWIALPGSSITMETFAGVPLFAYPSWFNSFSAHNVGCCILHISYSLWLFIRFLHIKVFLHLKEEQEKIPASQTWFDLHTVSSNHLALVVVTVGAEYFILPSSISIYVFYTIVRLPI